MKIKTTDRLFYRSFPYKAVFNTDWAVAATYFTKSDIPRIRRGDISDYGRANRAAKRYPREVIELIKFFDKFEKGEMRKRLENYSLSLFFKDRSVVDTLELLAPGAIVELWEPASEEALTFMESNTRTVVKKNLTHGCRYKVVLSGSVKKLSPDGRKNFMNLIKRNSSEFHITEDALDSFKRDYKYFYGHYFYVRDGKYLLMAQMMLQPIIKEVVKIVTYDEVANGVAV